MASRTERFERMPRTDPDPAPQEEEEEVRFSPEEEAALLYESDELKRLANNSFTAGEYANAVTIYDTALNTCPKYLHYERAVLKSNIAASKVKLAEWKDAEKVASESLDLLDLAEGKRIEDKEGPEHTEELEKVKAQIEAQLPGAQDEEADEEIISAGAAKSQAPTADEKRKKEIERIRTKALLRRAKARMELKSWSSLQGAEEDYKKLSGRADLTEMDKKVVRKALAELPPMVKTAQEKEMGEMMGKLKELGNGILKPFGLSTDSFNMVKDEKTGGYSLNFNQGGK